MFKQSSMSKWELMICVGVMGCGVGPLYSLTMMNLEEYLPVDSRASGVLYVFHNAGFLTVPWALGQIVDEHPYMLFAACIVSVSMMMVALLVLSMFRARIMHKLNCTPEIPQ